MMLSYSPPSKELWDEMKAALAQVSMSLHSHQQVQSILQQIERRAAMQGALPERSE